MPLYIFEDKKTHVRVPIFFIHIPKCGGTTIEHFFENVGFKSFLAPKDYRSVRGFLKVPPAHFDNEILNQLFFMDRIYSFAVARCPYSRILSDYKWAKTKTNNKHFFEKMSFDEFCSDSFKKYKKDNNYLANHITPQSNYLDSNVNKIFRLEDGLELAIKQVFSDNNLVINDNFLLPKINQSVEESIEIKPSTKDMIYSFYEEDFKNFGYAK